MKTKIPIKSQTLFPVLQKYKTDLQQLYGDRFEQLILYGSCARGQQHDESDIDLLLLLNSMNSPYSEIDAMSELNYSYLLNYELFFSVVPTTTEKFQNMPNPLYSNVKKEGILV